jgi:hypothetical protein
MIFLYSDQTAPFLFLLISPHSTFFWSPLFSSDFSSIFRIWSPHSYLSVDFSPIPTDRASMSLNTDRGGKLQSSGRLPNVGCPDCSGQMLRLVRYSTEGLGRIYIKATSSTSVKNLARYLVIWLEFF